MRPSLPGRLALFRCLLTPGSFMGQVGRWASRERTQSPQDRGSDQLWLDKYGSGQGPRDTWLVPRVARKCARNVL